MNDCIFCKIVKNEIPAEIVYADDLTMAFMDLKPVNPGHVLIIPKEHHDDFASTPADLLAAVSLAAQKAGRALMATLGAPGFNIGVNNGRAAGQLVDHMHMHVMPRFEHDGYELWHGKPYAEGEMARIAEKIRAAL